MTYGRFVICFVAAYLSNVLGCRFGYAVAHRQVELVLVLGLLVPLGQAVTSVMFIGAKSRKERVGIAVSAGIAMALAGTTVTLFLT
jgi:hypothetical protein